MIHQLPIIETERLILSEVKKEDLPLVVEYLQEKEFSQNTSNIPHPYRNEDAVFWLNLCKEGFEERKTFTFAIRHKDGKMIGAIGLHDENSDKAEMGYWIAKPFWSKGYATEAAKAVIRFGFDELEFNKIFATHFPFNPASGKILEKVGMAKEAVLKQHLKKDGKYLDMPIYSVFNENKRN